MVESTSVGRNVRDIRANPTMPARYQARGPARAAVRLRAASLTSETMSRPEFIRETFPVGPLQCNCTILGDPATGDALVIDPGDDAEAIVARLAELKLKPA